MDAGISKDLPLTSTGAVTVLNTLKECGDYLTSRFIGRRDEAVMLLCLDAKRMPLACRIVSEGSVNTAEVSVRKVKNF